MNEIDVIVPVFNGAKYIAETIISVQQQTLPAKRIIIADDGSLDETERVVATLMQADSRITYLKLPHAGVSAARNAGISESSAQFIAFLDADDVWLPEKLEKQMEVFAQGGAEIGFVHSSYFCIDENGMALENSTIFPPKLRGDIFLPLLLDGYVLSGSASSVLVRREVLDKAGHFDNRLFHGEDWDLWIRLAHVSKVDFTNDAVVGIRVHAQSAQRRLRPQRAFEFLQQQMLVFSRWEGITAADPRLKRSLQRRAIDAVLPTLRTPTIAQGFYRSLKMDSTPLAQTIFPSPVHFWMKVSGGVLRLLWWRVRRTIRLSER